VLKRNCSLSPLQLLTVWSALGAVSLGIGIGFWWLGAPAVLPFAGVEVLLLAAAFWHFARHAGDRETLQLGGGTLRVEQHVGGHVSTTSFRAEWLRVEPEHGDGSLIELSGQGQRIRIGRYLNAARRLSLTRELRLALQRERLQPLHQDLQLEP
jgi:uncharacterized membrane protein